MSIVDTLNAQPWIAVGGMTLAFIIALVGATAYLHRTIVKASIEVRVEAKADNAKAREEARADNQKAREEARADNAKAREEARADNQKAREEAKADNARAREEARADNQKAREETQASIADLGRRVDGIYQILIEQANERSRRSAS
ncbi:MAG: hypothetical protein QM621_01440 [Aeromicrobium sp.]|uniref:hypothetical protein n=1 Tax=Aeromicrobium sp. TaxID=1871063 RepID=UPI0039E2544A